MTIELTAREIAELNKTRPADRSRGGFQAYMVELKNRLNAAQEIELEHCDLEKINRYATTYRSGGYQTRLKKIFNRTLGKYLAGLKR